MAVLVNNEQEYLKDLDFLVEECLPQLKQKMNQQELNSIFSNIEVIRSFHQMLSMEFAHQLKVASDKQKIGAIIVKYGDFLKLYKPYCATQGIPAILSMEKTKSLKEFLEMKHKGQSLSEILLKPTQRLGVYPVLLKEIISFTPPKHVDYESLLTAVSKLEDVHHWNEEKTKHTAETTDKLEKLKDVHGSENVQINGKLIKEDDFDRIKDKEPIQTFHYYLFSDMLMTAQHSKALRKGYQLKKVFYFNQTLVRNVASNSPSHPSSPSPTDNSSHSSRPSHQLEVLDIETCKIYRFGMKSEEEKKEMLRFLQEAIYANSFMWSEDRSHLFNWFYEGMAVTDPMWNMVVCYRNFQTPLEFLTSLEDRVEKQSSGPDHVTVELLHTFMETIKRADVMDDASWHQMYERLLILISHVTNLAAKTYLLQVLDSLKFVAPKTRRHALKIGEQTVPDKSINRISVSLQRSPSQIHQDKRPGISPKEVAEEITQTEWNILRCVNEWELLNTNWNRTNGSELAPNILALIDRFNWTSRWISSKILRRDSPKKRADTLSSYIEMGTRFRELNNFNGIMEVLSSLHSTPISRLKETWALLTPQQSEEFQALTDLMKPDKNSHVYREIIASVEFRQPCMPYLGLFLSDLTFIEEANSKLVNGAVNPNYTSLMGAKLRMFKSYQKRKYQLMKPLYSIYGELVFGEEELYKLSKLREEANATIDPSARKSLLRADSRRFNKGSLNAALGEEEDIAVEKFLSKRDWQILLANAEALTLKQDEVLVQTTDQSSNMFLVNAGLLKMYLQDGRTLDVAPGEVCSKTSILGDPSNDSFITSIVACSDSTVSSINLSFLFRLFDTEFDLAARFFKYVANQLNNTLRQAMASYAKGSQVNHRRSVSLSVDPISINDSDKLFSTNFKQLPNEVVVKSYICKLGILAGNLYITKNYLCFNAKAFGLNKKKIIPLATISDIKANKGILEIFYETKKSSKKLTFRTEKELEDCHAITTSLWESARSRQVLPAIRTRSESAGGAVEDKEREKGFLSPDDWKLILKGTKCITCEPGTELITEGVRPGALYQIVKGVCNIQVKTGDRGFSIIATRKEGDIFGELSFLDEDLAASASVVTDGPVEIYVLDYNYMHIMLSVYKYLAPRFYKYIAKLLWDRMIQFLNRVGSLQQL